MGLTHFILIRRDMPTGNATAQITHAAGESFYWFGQKNPRTKYKGTTAVVLGVRDEKELKKWQAKLKKKRIPHVAIVEDAGILAGQLTAIGLVPTKDREAVGKVLRKLNTVSAFMQPELDG